MQALLDAATYPHSADDLELHETHISWVVLAGRYAYKVKKPVNFGFLDFSTVEQRAIVCREEVRLNRRLCPDVYRGVVRIVPHGRAYTLHPEPPATAPGDAGGAPDQATMAGEPAVWMRRLPADGMLTHLLARGAADARLMQRLARKLARFHATAPTGAGVDEYGTVEAIRTNWQENFDQTAPFLGQPVPVAAWQRIRRYVDRFLAEQAGLLHRRVAEGRIREGHGDLHAASVCVEGRRLQLFDCIEFNRRFRCGDVAAEVAFLAMDLDHHARADLAAAFVQAYQRATGDPDLRRLLRFYKCYRAFVRGKVLSFRVAEPGLSPDAAAGAAERARAYFHLAAAYTQELEPPLLVVVMGMPASGKTTIARALASRLALVHLESDATRKHLAGLAPSEHRRDRFGEGLYRPEMSQRTYRALRRRAARWLRAGQPVVLDATFGSRAERAAVRRLAARLGVPLVALECRAAEATLRRRLADRAVGEAHVPTTSAGAAAATVVTASDAHLGLWPQLKGAYAPPVEWADRVVLDTGGPLAATVERALEATRRYPG